MEYIKKPIQELSVEEYPKAYMELVVKYRNAGYNIPTSQQVLLLALTEKQITPGKFMQLVNLNIQSMPSMKCINKECKNFNKVISVVKIKTIIRDDGSSECVTKEAY